MSLELYAYMNYMPTIILAMNYMPHLLLPFVFYWVDNCI